MIRKEDIITAVASSKTSEELGIPEGPHTVMWPGEYRNLTTTQVFQWAREAEEAGLIEGGFRPGGKYEHWVGDAVRQLETAGLAKFVK